MSSVGSIFLNFSGWTSSHGIPSIGESGSKCMRLFWTILTLMSVGLLTDQMYALYVRFNQYDVIMVLKERPFPAITICGVNPLNANKLQRVPLIMDLASDFRTIIYNRSSVTTTTDPWKLLSTNNTIQLQNKGTDHLHYLIRHYANTTLNLATFDYKTLVMNCAFEGSTCLESDFESKLHVKYGKCFTYNFKSDNSRIISRRPGPSYGLRLLIRNDENDFLPTSSASGVRIAVHSQEDEAFVDAFGYNAAGSYMTSFGITYLRTERLASPFGNCTTTKIEPYYFSKDYSVEGCFRSCYQEAVDVECGCVDPRFQKLERQTYCAYNNNIKRLCVENMRKGSSSKLEDFAVVKQCLCNEPCLENAFIVTSSSAIWPAENHLLPALSGHCSTDVECHDWYRQNTLMVEVYYEQLSHQSFTESPAYGVINLVSDCGGQLGLWLGMSVISVVEFLILILMVVTFPCSKMTSNRLSPVPEEVEANEPDADQPKPETQLPDEKQVEQETDKTDVDREEIYEEDNESDFDAPKSTTLKDIFEF